MDKCQGIKKQIDPQAIVDPMLKFKESLSHVKHRYQTRTVPEAKVRKVMEHLKNKPSSGLDGISAIVLKAGIDFLVVPVVPLRFPPVL